VICNLLTVGTRGGILTGLGNGIALGPGEVWCVVSVRELGGGEAQCWIMVCHSSLLVEGGGEGVIVGIS